jgi:hypothetical protein
MIDRRTFLKATAATAGVLATPALTAFASDKKRPRKTPVPARPAVLLWGDERGDLLLWGDETGSLLLWGDQP